MRFLPLSTRILLGLIAGFCFGAIAPLIDAQFASSAADVLEPLGAVWLSALRLTVLPLVFALLVTGVGTVNRNASGGRIAAKSMGMFVTLLCFSALVAATLTPALLAAFPVDPAAAAALREGAGQAAPGAAQVPSLHDWLLGLMPSNIFEAASKGDVLQVVIFALLFGFAVARVAPAMRDTLLGFFQAVVEAMLMIVRWVLLVAPIGVFALASAVGRRGGFAAAGALGHYLATVCFAATVVTLAMYPLVRWGGGMPMARFARAIVPAQVLAFSTQSSLACLSAMIDVARSGLRLAPSVSAVTLPMAVSLFRFTSPVINLSVVVFVAHVSGVQIGVAQLIAGATVAVITNFAIVGLPSQIHHRADLLRHGRADGPIAPVAGDRGHTGSVPHRR